MASNTQGIQQLLAAEKKAADKVGEARKRKYFSAREVLGTILQSENAR